MRAKFMCFCIMNYNQRGQSICICLFLVCVIGVVFLPLGAMALLRQVL